MTNVARILRIGEERTYAIELEWFDDHHVLMKLCGNFCFLHTDDLVVLNISTYEIEKYNTEERRAI